MSENLELIPADVVGFALCRMNSKDELFRTGDIIFDRGRDAVQTILIRAAICGRVDVGSENGDYWADLVNEDGTWDQTVALDAESFRYLKRKTNARLVIGDPQ
jgi:hypothetical protein